MLSVTKKSIAILLALFLVFFIGRVYEAGRGPELHRWHTWSAKELTAQEIDNARFTDYLARENGLFIEMKRAITDHLRADEKTPLNRFNADSQVYPERFEPNWNRSSVSLPAGRPQGAVVLLHGLTDSPYSMQHVAKAWQQQGYVTVIPRLPGHGTAPGSLTTVDWRDWMAATRLAVREVVRLAGPDVPLHIVGYSNGGALAVKYALDSLNDASLPRPQQIVLLSPMIGVTAFARFSGLAGIPSIFPAFIKTAWLNVVPEYNPYKYNSFPVNAARQSWLLTQALQRQIQQAARNNGLQVFPPVLTFQSVVDSTVSARAVVEELYRYLPDNGSQLVIFDSNQAASLRSLFRPSAYAAVSTLLPPAPRRYSTTVITNASPQTYKTVARMTPAGEQSEHTQPLDAAWPQNMFSLSHVALPFPADDSLYGYAPAQKNLSGISLGTLFLQGETGTLMAGMDPTTRVTSNFLFPFLISRIQHNISCSHQTDIKDCINRLP